MEILAVAGIETVLFLDVPSAEDLAKFPEARAIGIAGLSRSQTPAWMRDHLPTAFDALSAFGAPLTHYKTCSTFDSSPLLGSVGMATDIGAEMFGSAWIPLVIGVPDIARYQLFGNLFAGLGTDTHRLDRHPIVSTHPATPMLEADVRRHLGRQTSLPVGLVNILELQTDRADKALSLALEEGSRIVAFDVLDQQTLVEIGRLVWDGTVGPNFAIGSQGLECALVAYWKAAGLLPDTALAEAAAVCPVDQLLVVSGSCSSVTAAQIDAAQDAGFCIVDLDVGKAAHTQPWRTELERVSNTTLDLLGQGRDVVVATARSERASESPNAAQLKTPNLLEDLDGETRQAVNSRIGTGLGWIVAQAVQHGEITRVVAAGGDTSGHAISTLGAAALSIVAPLQPGVPLCRIHSDNTDIDGLEVALKGGQMGSTDFFIAAKNGASFAR